MIKAPYYLFYVFFASQTPMQQLKAVRTLFILSYLMLRGSTMTHSLSEINQVMKYLYFLYFSCVKVKSKN